MRPCRLTPEDAPKLAAIDALCFADPWSERSFADALQGAGYAFFGCLGKEGLLGYAGMLTVLDEADVTNVAVLPTARRQGIGRSLVEALIAEARRREVRLLHLEVREGNEGARALYEGLGFRVDGRRKAYYRHPTEDAILMTLAVF